MLGGLPVALVLSWSPLVIGQAPDPIVPTAALAVARSADVTAPAEALAESSRADDAIGTEALARPRVDHSVSDQLIPDPRQAGRTALIFENARELTRARELARSGNGSAALEILDRLDTKLFPDRVALIRGQVLQARHDLRSARAAFETALREAQTTGVAQLAARGLISITGKLGQWEKQLEYIEALRASLDREPQLDLARVQTLIRLGRKEEARSAAWHVVDACESVQAASEAERLLVQLSSRGHLTRAERARVELGKARRWVRAGKGPKAIPAFERAKGLDSNQAVAIQLEMVDALRTRGSRPAAEAILDRLAEHHDLDDVRGEILLRRARLAADRYQYDAARAHFDAIARLPRSPAQTTAAYEAAQLEYDTGNYGRAAELMAALVKQPDGPSSGRALWLAAWCAYLAGKTSTALEMFERMLQAEPDADIRDRATYWFARAHERNKDREAAITTYRELALRSPLKYYGLLARRRLRALGQDLHLERPPARSAPGTVDEAVAMLGPTRPINVDRAVALFRGGMKGDGVEELLFAVDHYRLTHSRTGMAVMVDMFRMFDRPGWASVVARSIADDGDDQPGDDPDFWRVWRYAYPKPFENHVSRASEDHDVDPFLTYAVMRTESHFRPDAVSPVGARGLMQLMPATARWIGRMNARAHKEAARYRQPGSNIWLGSWYVRNLVDHYRGNFAQALGAYNAGPSAMDRWVRRFGPMAMDEFAERTPYTETRAYIHRTVESFMIYHELYDPQPAVLTARDQM